MTNVLKDKVSIITGAGTGIGKVIALKYAEEGAHVVGAGRRVEKLREVGREVASIGSKFLAVRCDVSKKDDCENVVKEALREFGKVDILVNNAGLMNQTPFLKITPEGWDAMLAINLKGPFLMSQAVLPHMIKQKMGKIIMVNSNNVRMQPFQYKNDHYIVSKMGLLALTRCLASEFASKGILVNGICCGYVPDTDQNSKINQLNPQFAKERFERVMRNTPLGRLLSAKDYGSIAVFLASDENNVITGQTISVDGGATME